MRNARVSAGARAGLFTEVSCAALLVMVAHAVDATRIRETAQDLVERPEKESEAMSNFQRFRNGKLETDWLALGASTACAIGVVVACALVSWVMTHGCSRMELPGGP